MKRMKDKARPFVSDVESSEPDVVQAPQPLKSRLASFRPRLIWTIVMLGIFFLTIAAGHFYCCLLVLLINVWIFNEIISLKSNVENDKKLPYFFVINWYFFFLTLLFLTLLFLKDRLLTVISEEDSQVITRYRYLAFFGLYVAGIVIFVLSLRKGQLRYQFGMFAWTHLTCLLVVAQSCAIMVNIYNGLVWFLLPASLVIVNDSFAYIFGVYLGRTRMWRLSPNKTWEGFAGGLVCTFIAAYLLSNFLARYEFFICPQHTLTYVPFQSVSCEVSDLSLYQIYKLPSFLTFFGVAHIHSTGLQLNAFVLGLFAGFIAPFGGFFASGIKRAFKIKDFGDSFPGHGGMTDRMDCQLLMGTFTCVWLQSVILRQSYTLNFALQVVFGLPLSDQVELYERLQYSLLTQGLVK